MGHPAQIAPLRTARLELRPLSFALAQAAALGAEPLSKALGMPLAAGWEATDFVQILPRLVPELAADAGLAAWNRLVIHAADQRLIGAVGFVTRPGADGSAELGFEILPEYRGQGLATEAALAVVAWAFRDANVGRLVAVSEVQNRASRAILIKLGFVQTRCDGELDHWQLLRSKWSLAATATTTPEVKGDLQPSPPRTQ